MPQLRRATSALHRFLQLIILPWTPARYLEKNHRINKSAERSSKSAKGDLTSPVRARASYARLPYSIDSAKWIIYLRYRNTSIHVEGIQHAKTEIQKRGRLMYTVTDESSSENESWMLCTLVGVTLQSYSLHQTLPARARCKLHPGLASVWSPRTSHR